MNKIDNGYLLPKFTGFDEIKLEKSDDKGLLLTPDWLKSAIIVEVRLDTASKDGTLKGAIPVLDHYREMGVNCIWVTPVNQMGTGLKNPNGYTNNGIDTIDPRLTGTDDYEEGWRRFGEFVKEAHKRDIRILLDVVVWGVDKEAPIQYEHPEYFKQDENGNLIQNFWGGPSYDVKGEAFRNWYKHHIVKIVEVTGIDGYRLDLEPAYAGYDFWADIRKTCRDKGMPIVIMSEHRSHRGEAFDFEQYGVMDHLHYDYYCEETMVRYNVGPKSDSQVLASGEPINYWLTGKDGRDIVTTTKNGKFYTGKEPNYEVAQEMQREGKTGDDRFYTYCLTNHDIPFHGEPSVIRFGYQAILAPVLPVWMMGDEVGMIKSNPGNCLYYFARTLTDVDEDCEAFEFYEDVKKMIAIRRQNADIFEYFPNNHRETNIDYVTVEGLKSHMPYCRYNDKKVIMVIPNGTEQDAHVKVFLPKQADGFDINTAKELLRDAEISISEESLNLKIPAGDMAVILVEKN